MMQLWQLGRETAHSQYGDWALETSLAKPFLGLTATRPDRVLKNVLCVMPLPQHALAIEEAYSRETDLIIRYGQSHDDQYAFQLNWRQLAVEAPWDLGLELWISVQTSLLDTNPVLHVSCDVAPAGWVVFRPMEHALRPERGQTAELNSGATYPRALIANLRDGSLLWMFEPSDHVPIELIAQKGTPCKSVQLFGNFMEKGVIRRARMRLLLSKSDVSSIACADIYQDFADSPLPLTA